MKESLILLVLFFLFSCDIPYINNEYSRDKVTTFNYLCDELKDHYVYTELKGVDIKGLRSEYALKVNNSMTDEAYFNLLSDFINEFEDGHANIFAPFAVSSSYSVIIDETSESYNPNFNWRQIKNYYLNDQYIYGYSLRNGIISRNDKKYGYIYYSSFVNSFTKSDIEYILNRFETAGVEGIILDIRGNGGGLLLNSNTLLSYFGYDANSTSKEILKVWRRDGINSYTKIDRLTMTLGVEVPFTIKTNKNGYRGNVALLTNRGCYSASSFTATAFKVYDNVKQFGDITGGGMGLPIGGTLPNGWKYRFSSNIAMPADATGLNDSSKNYENGVPVDFAVVDNPSTEEIDEIIDRAITWLDN